MASIPLSSIPNAPDLASMSAAKVNNVNIQNVDFSSQRRTIAAGYEQALENPKTAGAIGGAIAGVGTQAAQGATDYQKKQDALNGVVGKAQFDALNSQVMDEVNSSLDQSRPETFQGVYADKWKKVSDWYEQQPVGIQRAVYPDLIRTQYGNMATVSHFAHKTDLNNKQLVTESQIQQFSNQGLDQDAVKLTDEAMHSGLISVERRNEIVRTVQATKAGLAADNFIAQDPAKAAEILSRAASTGDSSHLPDWAKGLDSKEYGNLAKKAESVHYYREADKGMAVYGAIDNGDIKNVQQLEGATIYKTLTPEWQALAKSKLLNEVVSGSPEGIKAVGDAYGSLNKFRSGKADTIAKDYHDISLIGASLPPAEGKPFMKEVDDIFRKRSENGGVLPYDQQIRTSVSAELHKTYKEGGFGDPSSEEALSAYRQAEGEWNKVTADNPHSYAEAESKFWQAQKNAAAAAILKKEPVVQKPGFFRSIWNAIPEHSTKPQASNGSDQGKVTEYFPSEGYQSATKGPWKNKLDNESLAVSPDVRENLKAKGIKPFDKVKLTLADNTVVVRRYDDHTATDEEAAKQGLKPLRGRYDFRVSKAGDSKLDGVKVVKVEKYTENGQS